MSYNKLKSLVANVEAIETAMKIQVQGRQATAEEKEILSRYSGFGGIKEVLNIGIDCPPSLGLLTLNALTTADFLIIPVQAQFLAMRGMAKITSVIEIVKERLNPNLSIGGIVITQFDKRKTLNKSVAEIINDSFCDKVFKTLVRDNVALAEAPIKGKNVFEYNKNCNGAKDYMALAQEVLKLK